MKFALLTLLCITPTGAFTPVPKNAPRFSSKKSTAGRLPTSELHGIVPDQSHFEAASNLLLSYSDDPVGDQLKGVNGAVLGAIAVTVLALGAGFTALLPKVGSASFTLSDEELEAIQRVENGYDNKAWEKELTEQGTKGFVNRKRKAEEAKEKYQRTVDSLREMKDKSLRYSETDLGFVASLLRAAEPQPGDSLVNLGSGTGRSTVAAAAIYPSFKKVTGIEFLQDLNKLSKGYAGKVRGRKASVEFKSADFASEDLSQYDMAFVAGTYLNAKEVGQALSTLSSGAKVMTIDSRLGAGFQLITTVDDPSGDLVLNTGYVYQKL